jgi:hypothetical protein
MMMWIPETKSFLPSLCKKERNFPSLAIFFLPHRQARGVRGDFQNNMSTPYWTPQ